MASKKLASLLPAFRNFYHLPFFRFKKFLDRPKGSSAPHPLGIYNECIADCSQGITFIVAVGDPRPLACCMKT